MAEAKVVGIFYRNSESLIKSVTVQAFSFAEAVNYVEKTILREGEEIRNCQIITSNLDVKAAMAKSSYQLSFYDKNGGITDNIYIFSDNFDEVSFLISQKGKEGWRLNNCFYRESEFISII